MTFLFECGCMMIELITSAWTFNLHVGCITLSHPANGAVDINATDIIVAQYSCATGFTLVGDNMTRECINDTWTGTEPSCLGMQYFAWGICFILS